MLCPAQEKQNAGGGGEGGGDGVRGIACTGGYKGVRAVRPESAAGGGWSRHLSPILAWLYTLNISKH